MTERIAIKLTEVASDVLPFNLYEAEVGSYPYAVYNYTPEAVRTKDGVYKYTASTYIDVYSEDFDEALGKVELLESSISESMSDGEFTATLVSIIPECVEGVWDIQMSYIINQYK